MADSNTAQTFVLIPGAFLGGWSWQPVARVLAERGYPVLALTLPGLSYDGSPAGLGLADAIDYVVSEVERRDLADVVLVGHSWGGYPVTGAAHRLANRVAKVIYFSAVVPEQGTPMTDENEQYGEIIRQGIATSSDATVSIGLDLVQGILMPGDPAPLQELVSQMLLPQPGGYLTDSLDLPPVTKIGLGCGLRAVRRGRRPGTSRRPRELLGEPVIPATGGPWEGDAYDTGLPRKSFDRSICVLS
jgi:pimeloyl-ACP methyl ester carboxylesterase